MGGFLLSTIFGAISSVFLVIFKHGKDMESLREKDYGGLRYDDF